jgi:hypothetical protein
MLERRYKMAEGDVSKVFDTPSAIVEARDLSTPEKIELLRNWDLDLRQILVASEEGMNRDQPGRASDTLREVQSALDALGAAKGDTAAPNKAGGSSEE